MHRFPETLDRPSDLHRAFDALDQIIAAHTRPSPCRVVYGRPEPDRLAWAIHAGFTFAGYAPQDISTDSLQGALGGARDNARDSLRNGIPVAEVLQAVVALSDQYREQRDATCLRCPEHLLDFCFDTLTQNTAQYDGRHVFITRRGHMIWSALAPSIEQAHALLVDLSVADLDHLDTSYLSC